ncbi:MAG: hypothetical protein CM1200mP10_07750 [Candidatus Neomarinimicrobiota bacterium]|nr:MAG: hypothetical protein CM1200mP10_07750 [Candidatus Neomarinimicrobiota bacterium]
MPGGGLTVNAVRRSWSTTGESNKYFKVGEHDYNDFVIDEVHVINTSTSNVDGLVFGSKLIMIVLGMYLFLIGIMPSGQMIL